MSTALDLGSWCPPTRDLYRNGERIFEDEAGKSPMAPEACAPLETPWPDVVSGCAEYGKRTLEALVSAWRTRGDTLPRGVYAAIFDDLLADAQPVDHCIELHPSEVFIDVFGVAKIDSPRVERADVRAVTSLLQRVAGYEAPSAIDVERARAWIAEEMGPIASRAEVRAYVAAVRVAEGDSAEREWITGDIVFPQDPVDAVPEPEPEPEPIGAPVVKDTVLAPSAPSSGFDANAIAPPLVEGPSAPVIPPRIIRHTLSRAPSWVRVQMAPAARRSARPRGNSRLQLPAERAHSRAWAVAFLLLGVAALLSIFGIRAVLAG